MINNRYSRQSFLGKKLTRNLRADSYAEKNGSALREDIKRRKAIDVRVMKPRGLIIAGERKQLKDEIMEDNFRLLNKSLKNLGIILYDELLDHLKLFLSRLKK